MKNNVHCHMSKLNNMQPVVQLFRLEMELQRAMVQNQYKNALYLYDQIIAIKEQIPNKLGLAKTLFDKAFLLEQLGYTRDALQNYKYANNVAAGTPNQTFLNNILTKIQTIQSQTSLDRQFHS